MATVFKKITGEDGTESFVEVEVATILSESEEGLALQAKLKKANDEARDLRLAQKPKKPAVLALIDDAETDTPQAPSTAAPSVKQQPVIDEAGIVERATQAAIARMQEQQAAQVAAAKEMNGLLEKHNLPAAMLNVLLNSKDPSATAEELGRANLSFAGASGGRAPKGNSVSDAARAAYKTLEFDFPEE